MIALWFFPVRDAKHTNFVEFRNFKIIYRRYAGLYFCICVDVSDNNLFYLEAIHNFVEVLNEYFHNVCELDLVFNFYKVYTIVDEMFLAGELRETSQTKVLKQLLMLNSLEWVMKYWMFYIVSFNHTFSSLQVVKSLASGLELCQCLNSR